MTAGSVARGSGRLDRGRLVQPLLDRCDLGGVGACVRGQWGWTPQGRQLWPALVAAPQPPTPAAAHWAPHSVS